MIYPSKRVTNTRFICMQMMDFADDISVHNNRVRPDGAGIGREAFAVTHRFRSTTSIHAMQGWYTAGH